MVEMYFGDATLSDVVLLVDGHKFHVHKMMLSNHSDYFRKLFYDGLDQILTNTFEIKDVSPKTFKRLLQFIYKGEIDDADSFMPCCRVCKPPWSDGSRRFWEETSNLLDAAERFAMSKSIKKYVARMISKDACNCGCWECFDGFIFSSAYNLDVVQRNKRYNLITIKGWCENMAKNIPKRMKMDVTQLYTILHSVKIL